MEILNNFASIYCFISFVIGAVLMLISLAIGAVLMLISLAIGAMDKDYEPRNKVHYGL